jgi:hypothetical protein
VAELHAIHDVGRSVDVSAGGVVLARYVYAPDDPPLESPRPYLHPVRTRAGRIVTGYRPHDHVWHKGIAWSLPCVGPHNFWGGPTYMHGQGYVQLQNNGSMVHEELLDLVVGPDRVGVTHDLGWWTEQGERIVTEARTLTAVLPDRPDAWVLTFDTAMTNVSAAPLPIGSPTTRGRDNAGYGGLFWRGPRSFTGGELHTPAGSGGDELRGEREQWMAFTGRHDEVDAASTVVMVDHADNPASPPQWFARTEQFGCLNPAPFFSAEIDFDQGETLRFRYAVVIADGAADAARAGDLAALGATVLGSAG